MADNSRRMLDFHIERAKESMDAAGAYKIEVDRLMRYSGWHLLGHGADGRRPDDVRAGSLEPRPRRPEPVRRRRLVLRHVDGREPDVHDRRDRPAGGRPHGRDALRAAGAGMTDAGYRYPHRGDRRPTMHGGMPATRTTADARRRERATFAAIADHLIPAAAWHAVGGGRSLTDDRLAFVLRARPDLAEPLKAASGRSSALTSAERLDDPRRRADQPRGPPADDRRRATTPTSGVRELIGYPGQMALELRSWE